MGDFLAAAMGFPTVLFSFLLVVVVGFWVLVLLGGADAEILDGDGGSDSAMLRGLGGVPLTVALSLMIALAWFASLAGTVLLDRAGAGRPIAAVTVLVVALLLAWLGTRVLVAPLRRVFADDGAASRADFVGRLCVIRTGRVDLEFGRRRGRVAA